jgi:hypothetical protein
MKDNPLKQLETLGQSFRISIDKLAQQLEDEGVEKFNRPSDNLMETLAKMLPRQVMERP